MTTKQAVYSFIESITPPLLFRLFKSSFIYTQGVRLIKKFSKKLPTKEMSITDGDMMGLKLKLSGNGSWQKEMIAGTYDHELFSYVRNLPLQDKVVYDIGAHICYHSLAFAKYTGNKGHVYAFEPNPANVERAKEITELNPSIQTTITILNTALSDKVGTTKFLSTSDVEGGTSTGGFIDDASTIWTKEVFIEKTGFKISEVEVNTIDNLVNTKKILPPHMMKIDVEGAEQLVLEGAKQTIAKHHPIILVEFHSTYSAYSCMEILAAHKYSTKVLKIESDGRVMVVATYGA